MKFSRLKKTEFLPIHLTDYPKVPHEDEKVAWHDVQAIQQFRSSPNPCDHPHGGGEGRAPVGRTRPLTPWGKPALGMKTRKRKKLSNSYILRRSS